MPGKSADSHPELAAGLRVPRWERITRNVATGIKMPRLRTRTIQPWSVEEARRFLESARNERDPFYPAYVLILVLGLRRGEMLGLTWPMVNLDTAEVEIRYGLQRIGGRLVHGLLDAFRAETQAFGEGAVPGDLSGRAESSARNFSMARWPIL